MRDRWRLVLFCIGVIYLTLFYQLGNLAFVGADEPRYARIGEEMNLRGGYVTPTLNFRPWLEKPPLLFWLEAASFVLFGVHEWSARFPVAVLGLLTLLVVALFAYHLTGSRASVFALLVLCTSSLFFVFARAASTDTPLTAMLSLAMLSAFQAGRSSAPLWAAGWGLALGLAVLAKGPVALLLFAAVFFLYFLITQKLTWTLSQMALGVTVFLLITVPWFWQVWRENGHDFVATFWINHHLARFVTEIHHHAQPIWYYPAVLVAGFFPWICFLGSAVVRTWKTRAQVAESDEARLFLWLWALVPLVFFSLSESKLAGYVLPVMPPLALLVALEWDAHLEGDVTVHRVMRGQFVALGGIAVLLVGTLIWGFGSMYETTTVGILLALPILIGTAWAFLEYRRRRLMGVFFSLVAGMTLFAALAFWKGAPLVDDYHSARDVCHLALPWISSEEPLILYRYFHQTARYYADYQTTNESVPDLSGLQAYFRDWPQEQYHVLTQESGWYDLQQFNPKLLSHQGNLYLLSVTPGD